MPLYDVDCQYDLCWISRPGSRPGTCVPRLRSLTTTPQPKVEELQGIGRARRARIYTEMRAEAQHVTRGGACVGDSVVSVNVTFFSSHHLRYRLSLGAWQSLLRAAISTATSSSSL